MIHKPITVVCNFEMSGETEGLRDEMFQRANDSGLTFSFAHSVSMLDKAIFRVAQDRVFLVRKDVGFHLVMATSKEGVSRQLMKETILLACTNDSHQVAIYGLDVAGESGGRISRLKMFDHEKCVETTTIDIPEVMDACATRMCAATDECNNLLYVALVFDDVKTGVALGSPGKGMIMIFRNPLVARDPVKTEFHRLGRRCVCCEFAKVKCGESWKCALFVLFCDQNSSYQGYVYSVDDLSKVEMCFSNTTGFTVINCLRMSNSRFCIVSGKAGQVELRIVNITFASGKFVFEDEASRVLMGLTVEHDDDEFLFSGKTFMFKSYVGLLTKDLRLELYDMYRLSESHKWAFRRVFSTKFQNEIWVAAFVAWDAAYFYRVGGSRFMKVVEYDFDQVVRQLVSSGKDFDYAKVYIKRVLEGQPDEGQRLAEIEWMQAQALFRSGGKGGDRPMSHFVKTIGYKPPVAVIEMYMGATDSAALYRYLWGDDLSMGPKDSLLAHSFTREYVDLLITICARSGDSVNKDENGHAIDPQSILTWLSGDEYKKFWDGVINAYTNLLETDKAFDLANKAGNHKTCLEILFDEQKSVKGTQRYIADTCYPTLSDFIEDQLKKQPLAGLRDDHVIEWSKLTADIKNRLLDVFSKDIEESFANRMPEMIRIWKQKIIERGCESSERHSLEVGLVREEVNFLIQSITRPVPADAIRTSIDALREYGREILCYRDHKSGNSKVRSPELAKCTDDFVEKTGDMVNLLVNMKETDAIIGDVRAVCLLFLPESVQDTRGEDAEYTYLQCDYLRFFKRIHVSEESRVSRQLHDTLIQQTLTILSRHTNGSTSEVNEFTRKYAKILRDFLAESSNYNVAVVIHSLFGLDNMRERIKLVETILVRQGAYMDLIMWAMSADEAFEHDAEDHVQEKGAFEGDNDEKMMTPKDRWILSICRKYGCECPAMYDETIIYFCHCICDNLRSRDDVRKTKCALAKLIREDLNPNSLYNMSGSRRPPHDFPHILALLLGHKACEGLYYDIIEDVTQGWFDEVQKQQAIIDEDIRRLEGDVCTLETTSNISEAERIVGQYERRILEASQSKAREEEFVVTDADEPVGLPYSMMNLISRGVLTPALDAANVSNTLTHGTPEATAQIARFMDAIHTLNNK